MLLLCVDRGELLVVLICQHTSHAQLDQLFWRYVWACAYQLCVVLECLDGIWWVFVWCQITSVAHFVRLRSVLPDATFSGNLDIYQLQKPWWIWDVLVAELSAPPVSWCLIHPSVRHPAEFLHTKRTQNDGRSWQDLCATWSEHRHNVTSFHTVCFRFPCNFIIIFRYLCSGWKGGEKYFVLPDCTYQGCKRANSWRNIACIKSLIIGIY